MCVARKTIANHTYLFPSIICSIHRSELVLVYTGATPEPRGVSGGGVDDHCETATYTYAIVVVHALVDVIANYHQWRITYGN